MRKSFFLAAGFVVFSSLTFSKAHAQTCITALPGVATQEATLGPNCAASAQSFCDAIRADLALTSGTNRVFTNEANNTGGISPCDETGNTEWPTRMEFSNYPSLVNPGDSLIVDYTTRAGEMNCFQIQPDGSLLRAFVCNNGCGYLEDPFDPSNNCPETRISGDHASSTFTENPDGSSTLSITSTPSQGYTHTYEVTIPAGGTIGDVTVVGGNRPKISISASLPPGETKEITMTRGEGDRVCVKDQSQAQFTAAGGACPDDRIRLQDMADCPSFSTHSVSGDPGDNGDPIDGTHNIEACKDNVAGTVTFRNLLHTVIEMLVDSDGDDVIDEEDLCPDTDLNGPIPTRRLRPGHMGDDRTIYGCNASQILECMPARHNGQRFYGLSPGVQKIFRHRIGWAAHCYPRNN